MKPETTNAPTSPAELEWTQHPQQLELTREALARMQALVEAPPTPSPRLRAAAKRRGKGA